MDPDRTPSGIEQRKSRYKAVKTSFSEFIKAPKVV